MLPEVTPLRRASRQFVRELGFLDNSLAGLGVSHSECHTLIELAHFGVLTAKEIARRLNLDKSTMSRTVRSLSDQGLVKIDEPKLDRRQKPLSLTTKGRRRVDAINDYANQQVDGALSLLKDSERRTVVEGMALYARALSQLRAHEEFEIRPIQKRDDPHVARLIRTVIPEFGVSGAGTAMSDAEVDGMYRAYNRPGAGFYVITKGDAVVGGGGFAPLQEGDQTTCELRKMYFLPEARGLGLGRALLVRILEDARLAGYRRCYLETLDHMSRARNLYRSLGFEELDAPMGSTGHYACDRWMVRAL